MLRQIPRIARRFPVFSNIERRVFGLHFIGPFVFLSEPDISGYLHIIHTFSSNSDLKLTMMSK